MQKQYLTDLLKRNPKAVIIGSLGTISYDLKDIPHKNKILVAGAMGCVMGIGLGYALSSKKKVIVIIGDGAFLMKAGSLATVNRYNRGNLEILIIDNGKHASCGEQQTHYQYFLK